MSNAVEKTLAEPRGNTVSFEVQAEIVVSHARFPLAPTLAGTPLRARVDLSSLPESVAVVEVAGDDIDEVEAFETGLASDPTVRVARRVSGEGTRRTFAVEVDSAHAAPFFEVLLSPTIRLFDVRADKEGWHVSFETTDRSEVRALTERLPPAATVEVRRLGTGAVADAPSNAALTARQRTVLRTALERGYFAVPRGCTQTDLADEFDVSPAAVSQQIRRSVRRLVESTDIVDATN